MSPTPPDDRETGGGRGGGGGGRQVDREEEGPVPLAHGQASSATPAFSAPPISPPPGAELTVPACPPGPAEGEGDRGAPAAGDSKRRAADLCGAALSKVAEVVRSDLRGTLFEPGSPVPHPLFPGTVGGVKETCGRGTRERLVLAPLVCSNGHLALSGTASVTDLKKKAASEEFKVLETANALTRDLYGEMNLRAQDVRAELSTLQKIFSLSAEFPRSCHVNASVKSVSREVEDMAPNLALVDEVCGQVDRLFALVVGLDEHTKALGAWSGRLRAFLI
ncbi:MAG: hypothetical protein BJ554DRAFT_6956 [Olpidium bornovanus]|uniref:Uncharacterized protein n=1 Tax=Olpidium bornovanus TaxID=278681 RepID=A0A8H7ZXR5_9FUNG|nr:MAG: hypothetical protein BJ554DRAFT_6956 [Olpidium bornovanus]